MSPRNEAVITGLGSVSPLGLGHEAVWQAMLDGRSGVGPLTRFDGSHLGVRIAAEVRDFDVRPFTRQRKAVKLMSREIQFAVAAAQLAMADAGLDADSVDPTRLAVIQGVDEFYAPLEELAPVYRACLVDGVFQFDRWTDSYLRYANPLSPLKHMCVMAASHVSIELNAQGPSNTIGTGSISGLLALREAVDKIRRDVVDVVVVGATGCLVYLDLWVKFARYERSRRNDCPAEACRPFDLDRDGMVLGEGAGALVVESREHARRRGAETVARVVRVASNYRVPDPGKLGSAAALATALTGVLDETTAAAVGHINAHGLATRADDRDEAAVIRSTLGAVPVTANKSCFGDLGAGAGLIELSMAALALRKTLIPPTLNYQRRDPNCDIDVVHGEPRPCRREFCVKLGYDRLGNAAAVLLGRP